jgi:hypothetical protein
MAVDESNFARVLYPRQDIWAFRSIERFSDYKRIKARTGPSAGSTARIHFLYMKLARCFLLSNKSLTIIIAVGTVILVILAIATLFVMLL